MTKISSLPGIGSVPLAWQKQQSNDEKRQLYFHRTPKIVKLKDIWQIFLLDVIANKFWSEGHLHLSPSVRDIALELLQAHLREKKIITKRFAFRGWLTRIKICICKECSKYISTQKGTDSVHRVSSKYKSAQNIVVLRREQIFTLGYGLITLFMTSSSKRDSVVRSGVRSLSFFFFPFLLPFFPFFRFFEIFPFFPLSLSTAWKGTCLFKTLIWTNLENW